MMKNIDNHDTFMMKNIDKTITIILVIYALSDMNM